MWRAFCLGYDRYMSEETPEFDPSESMTPDTFSFFDVLEERTYPKEVLDVFMDEAAAYDLNKLSVEIDMTPREEQTPEKIEEFKQRAEALQHRISNSKFTFYLTGVSDDKIETATEVANSAFEDKKVQKYTATKTIEKYLPESEQLNYIKYFNAVVMSLHVEQIVEHRRGRVMTAPGPDEILRFLDKAPTAAKNALNDAVQALRVRSSAYEGGLDEGFLAKS